MRRTGEIIVIFFSLALFIYLLHLAIGVTNKLYFPKLPDVNVVVSTKENKRTVLTKYSEHLTNLVQNEFNRTVKSLNFTIVCFSVALTIFGLLIGLFSFSKIKEINNLVTKTKNLPAEILSTFYTQQKAFLKDEILDNDLIKRSAAIKSLALNPEVGPSDYNVIQSALEKEIISVENTYLATNISDLTVILLKIKPESAYDDLFKIIDNAENTPKLYPILTYALISQKPEHKEKIKEYLTAKDQTMSAWLISILIQNNSLTEDYVAHILINGTSQSVIKLFGQWSVKPANVGSNFITESLMKRAQVEIAIANSLMFGPFKENIPFKQIHRIIAKSADNQPDEQVRGILWSYAAQNQNNHELLTDLYENLSNANVDEKTIENQYTNFVATQNKDAAKIIVDFFPNIKANA